MEEIAAINLQKKKKGDGFSRLNLKNEILNNKKKKEDHLQNFLPDEKKQQRGRGRNCWRRLGKSMARKE